MSTTAIQALIEGAWAEGMDRKGAERYGGKLVGKTSEHACIGASEVLVALWHKRCNSFMIQFTGSQEKEVLDNDGVPTVYLDYENQPVMALRRMVSNLFDPRELHNHGRRWVELPMFLQISGRSCLVVGVTTRNRTGAPCRRPDRRRHSRDARRRNVPRKLSAHRPPRPRPVGRLHAVVHP